MADSQASSDLFDVAALDPTLSYFAFSRTERNGRLIEGVHSIWVGFPSGAPEAHAEIRQASEVNPERLADVWAAIGQPWMVVSSLYEWFDFVRIGGNALVESTFARTSLGDRLQPFEVRRSGPFGFDHFRPTDREVSRHRPRPAQRKRILDRDGHRCQRCRSTETGDLQLHHVRLFSAGGPTTDDNLITLCSDCHRSLDPHEDLLLFWLTDGIAKQALDRERTISHLEAAERYRHAIGAVLSRLSA